MDIIVAAEMILISTPFSGAPKIESPTVKGLVSGVLVTIKGHKKLARSACLRSPVVVADENYVIPANESPKSPDENMSSAAMGTIKSTNDN